MSKFGLHYRESKVSWLACWRASIFWDANVKLFCQFRIVQPAQRRPQWKISRWNLSHSNYHRYHIPTGSLCYHFEISELSNNSQITISYKLSWITLGLLACLSWRTVSGFLTLPEYNFKFIPQKIYSQNWTKDYYFSFFFMLLNFSQVKYFFVWLFGLAASNKGLREENKHLKCVFINYLMA